MRVQKCEIGLWGPITETRMARKLTYLSLFSNAGIGCYGFKQESFECIATNELLEERIRIQKYNHKCKYETGYICGDITDSHIKSRIYEEIVRWKEFESLQDIDVVIATPPCQGMSVANHKKKDELPRNSLVIESLLIIEKVEPMFFVIENVQGFLGTSCTDSDKTGLVIREAIEQHLGGLYNILYTVENFSDFGNPSSRTRSLVLGTRKDLSDITPYDIFPEKQTAPTLKQSIGHLKRLKIIGEVDPNDIFHNFRSYPEHMLAWVKGLKEGQSAFDNKDPRKIPHQVVDGERIPNKRKNGDKYTRCFWNKVGPCIHTRNDQFASQNTIHPEDNRVFSIREIMNLMSVPVEFKWTDIDSNELN